MYPPTSHPGLGIVRIFSRCEVPGDDSTRIEVDVPHSVLAEDTELYSIFLAKSGGLCGRDEYRGQAMFYCIRVGVSAKVLRAFSDFITGASQ